MVASDMYGTMMMMVLADGVGRMGWGWDGWCKWSQKHASWIVVREARWFVNGAEKKIF